MSIICKWGSFFSRKRLSQKRENPASVSKHGIIRKKKNAQKVDKTHNSVFVA
jgi:hypothetical protein